MVTKGIDRFNTDIRRLMERRNTNGRNKQFVDPIINTTGHVTIIHCGRVYRKKVRAKQGRS
jgi:hypothetical protein